MNNKQILNKIKNLEKESEKLTRELEELKREVSEDKGFVDGEEYYFLYPDGSISNYVFDKNLTINPNLVKLGTIARTPEELEKLKLKLESIAQRGREPEEDEESWYWSFFNNCPFQVLYSSLHFSVYHAIGAVHKTEEDCRAWGDKFAGAFKD
jgi:hypothetical protein